MESFDKQQQAIDRVIGLHVKSLKILFFLREFDGSTDLRYIAEELGMTRKTIKKYIQPLVERNLAYVRGSRPLSYAPKQMLNGWMMYQNIRRDKW